MDAERSAGRPLQTTAASPWRLCRCTTGALLRAAYTRRLGATVASCARRRPSCPRRANHRGDVAAPQSDGAAAAAAAATGRAPPAARPAPAPARTSADQKGNPCTHAHMHRPRPWACIPLLLHCCAAAQSVGKPVCVMSLPRCLSRLAAGPESRTSPSTAASSTRPAPANASFHTPTCPPPWRLR
jgi:hypothetical protein